LDAEPISDSSIELVDVPAAVVCAHCGAPDCTGCQTEDEPTHASGIVAIVPWERAGSPTPVRLWSTARLTTLSSDSFFSALPEGDVAPPLRFAILAELLAVTGMCVVAVPVVLAFAPWALDWLGRDPWLRSLVLRAIVVAIPGLALFMVGVHAAHGVGLDLGARRVGAKSRPSRGLRFGLYACGWDLVTLPAGLAMLAISDGFGTARRAAPLSLTVPHRATRAFLRGCYRLDDAQAARAARIAIILASALIAVASGLAIIGLVLATIV
jgi:hypothetical protein